jgi:glycosyltransferase involved in cell wall biosynthesis
LSADVRVHVVDPSAYTPPYDDALCSALARAGAEVELFTSRFVHGPLPPARGYARHESFYPRSARIRSPALRRAAKLAEHVPGMLGYRRRAARADVVHFQWLTVQHLDGGLLPRTRPLVLTAHDVLPREPRPGQAHAQARLYRHFDAVVVHTEQGARRLADEAGVAPGNIHVIPHGVLRPWEGSAAEPLPPELADSGAPVVLFAGLLRPYKGLDVLLRAWNGLGDEAQLWIVGAPRMDTGPLRASLTQGASLVERFVGDGELHALLQRASLVVLPYREVEQSGVAFSALGAGVPLLLSDAGGFGELAAQGAARTFPAGDADALRSELGALLADRGALAQMADRALALADGEYSWDAIAARTLALYTRLAG